MICTGSSMDGKTSTTDIRHDHMAASNLHAVRVIGTACVMLVDILLIVSLVVINKALYDSGWPFPILLVALHFSSSGLVAAAWLHCWPPAVNADAASSSTTGNIVPFSVLFGLSLSQAFSTALANSSLVVNALGVYQVMKMTTIPWMVLLQCVPTPFGFCRSQPPSRVRRLQYAALVCITVGSALTSFSYEETNPLGVCFGLAAAAAAAVNQLSAGAVQARYKIPAASLMYQQAPLTSFLVYSASFSFDRYLGALGGGGDPLDTQTVALPATGTDGCPATSRIFGDTFWVWLLGSRANCFAPTLSTVVLVVCTCVCAGLANILTYVVIQRSSAIAYQVTSHVKGAMIVVFALLSQPSVSLASVSGIGLTLVGAASYSYCGVTQKLKE